MPRSARSALRDIEDSQVGRPDAKPPATARGARAVVCPPVRPLVRPVRAIERRLQWGWAGWVEHLGRRRA
eukprot:5552011-Pleurochrysis_carterae.AAC.1